MIAACNVSHADAYPLCVAVGLSVFGRVHTECSHHITRLFHQLKAGNLETLSSIATATSAARVLWVLLGCWLRRLGHVRLEG